jgi:hypothetical protein
MMMLSSTVAHTVAASTDYVNRTTHTHKKDVLLYCARANKH